MVLPFALEGTLEGKICAAVINMVIGLCIASLVSAVLSRTVVDPERRGSSVEFEGRDHWACAAPGWK